LIFRRFVDSVWKQPARQPRPLPVRWQRFLKKSHRHYQRLPPELRMTFDQAAQTFVAEKRITGIEMKVTETLKILVAASAVTLSFRWPGYKWHQLVEVLLYPDNFDEDYSFGGTEMAGMVDHWGTVILSVPALRYSFKNAEDSYHVGFHEFAHVLDLEGSRTDGIPPGLNAAQSHRWVEIQRTEMERLRLDRSILNPHGMISEVEFFAVSVQTFFQTPLAIRAHHPELYAFLRGYFDQDPATWEEELTKL
jgi:Mlc titration factor MtfA (ptsG expression regulator)